MKEERNMFKRILLAVALLAVGAFAKHDGEYVTTMRGIVKTPHYEFGRKGDKPLRVLFIVNRQGARDAVELAERMPLEAEYFITYDREIFSSDSIYESSLTATTYAERKALLDSFLEKEYDLYVIGRFNFAKLPEEAKYTILSRVENGAGLVTARMPYRLPYKKVYATPIQNNDFLKGFAPIDGVKKVNVFQLGKGRVVEICNEFSNDVANSLTSHIPYSNRWYAKYENAMAHLGASLRFAAGLETEPTNPKVRIRNVWNREVDAQNLPGGTYFKDELGENGAFKVSEMVVKPQIGIASIEVPEEIKGREIPVKVTLSSPTKAVIRIELIDSPYRKTWWRRSFKIGAKSAEHTFTINKGGLSTLAGYVRVSLIDDERVDDIVDSVVFFPSNSIDDYLQMAWDGSNCAPGDLMQGKQVDELGWNYVLTHPSRDGSNLRALALLNQKKVLYTTRVMIKKGAKGALELGYLGMMSKEQRAEVDKIQGEHSLYDERFQNAWKQMIESRTKGYSKYSIALYSLGDENELAYDTGYGENNLEHFRRFLFTRYGTIEKLNDNWRRDYSSFDEVPHLTMQEAKDSKNYAAWRDHRAFMEKMYADMHIFSSNVIKEIDPDARVGAEGSVPGDLELSMSGLEFWGPYASAVGDELLRSFAGDKVRTIWWGGYPGTHGGRGTYPNPLLRDLVRGCVNGSAWFACLPGSNHSSFTCDLDYAQYVKQYIPELSRMRRGAAQELIVNPLYMHDKILIYWSHASSDACKLDPRCPNPNDSIIAIINDLYSKGLGFDFVSQNCLERLKNARVLFLCGASALSDEECRAILDFAKNGGIVVIDANPAIMNEFLCPRKNSPLEFAIGEMNWNSAWTGKLRNDGGVQKTVYGKPVDKRFGKGFIRLLGHTLGVYSATKDDFGSTFMASVFSLGNGLKQEYFVTNGKPNMFFRIRECGDHRILGAWVTESTMGTPMTVNLPYQSYIYKLDGGFVGYDDKIVMPFKDTPLELYSCFDREQKPPRFKVGNASFGSPSRLQLPQLTRGRFLRLEIFNPNGQLRSMHVFDRQATVPSVTFAAEEPEGVWSAVLTDVATGLSSSCEFKYNK